MTAGQTGPSLFVRYKINSHFPAAECNFFFHQKGRGGTMYIVTHSAVPAFVPVDMQPVKIFCSVPESGTPFRFPCIQEIRIMTEEAKFKILR
jgi:hypothetical protein